MASIKHVLKEAITDSQGQYDLGYLLWVAGVVVFLGLSIMRRDIFEAQQFGVGFASILGAGGAMTWMRSKGGVTQ